MSTGTKLVGPAEFCRETGLTKPTFYSLLSQMVEAGVAAKTQKKIDLNCEWMQSYLTRNRKTMTLTESFKSEEKTDEQISDEIPLLDTENLAPLNLVMHLKEIETVNKLRIDNAIKAKRVVSKKIVIVLIEKIDDAFNKIIMDGEASFVPQLIQMIKAGCKISETKDGMSVIEFTTPEEDVKKFWRKEIGKILSPVKPFMQRIIKRFQEDKK